MRRITQESVEQFFIDNNCILLDEYKNMKTKMKFLCVCGNIGENTFERFQKGARCKKCTIERRIEPQRNSYEYVFQFFKENNCILLSKEYENTREPLEYQCECGSIAKISFAAFKRGQRCKKCKIKKQIERTKLSYDFVYNEFKKQGCILLETNYLNAKQKLRYICSCGEEDFVSYDKFKSGERCQKCYIENRSGENCYKWNPDLTEEERLIQRNYPEYRDWARKVKERDNFTCQKCKKIGGELASHHINNYKDFEEERLELDNGITFCVPCHMKFHSLFGFHGTNEIHLYEYLSSNNI